MKILNLGNPVVNNYMYQTENGYILIDTGYEGGFHAFSKKLHKKGLSTRDIAFVFLTHAHDDHAGFLNALLQDSKGTKLIVHPNALEGLDRGQNSFDGGCTSFLALVFCNFMKLLGKGEHRFPPFDQQLKDRLLIISGETQCELEEVLNGKIIETPGHTCDSISLLLRDGTLFCGDAAMNGFPSLHKITIWAENKFDFLKSWQTLIAMNPRKLYPAHGKPFDCKELTENIDKLKHVKLYTLHSKK